MELSTDKKIRIKMVETNIKGAQIARELGVHRASINKTIRGKLKSFRLRKAIADALKLRVEDLWPEEKKSV
jgi:predicted XRE-type DNA-binding protein